jgi:hypothetical protein
MSFCVLASPVSYAADDMAVVQPGVAADAWDVSCEKMEWPSTENSAFGAPESLKYSVHWGGINAGGGEIDIKGIATVHDRPAYIATMTLGTTGVANAMHAYSEKTFTSIDRVSLLPLRYRKETREGTYARDEDVNFDPPCQRLDRVEHRLDKGTVERKQARLPGPTLDILGYLFYIRTLPLAVGRHYDMTLVSGNHLWPVTVTVKDKLQITTAAGRFECFFIEPTLRENKTDAKLKELQVWVTADARKIPVRLRMEANVGHITADLAARP